DHDIQNEVDNNIENTTGKDYKIKANGNTNFSAKKHIRVGDMQRQGAEYLSGIDVAADHIVGTASVSPSKTKDGDEEIIVEVDVSLIDIGARVAALESASRSSTLNKLADIFSVDDAGNITIKGDLTVGGTLTVSGAITAREVRTPNGNT